MIHWKTFIAGLAWIAVWSAPTLAQVSVAPTALFLTDQERFGALHVTNQASAAQEVTVGFRFGYTATDSTGSVRVQYGDTTAAQRHSIAPYVRAFPQRFILPPGESQIVRLTARPPSDAESGWLWSRIITTSTPQVAFDPDTTEGGVRTNIIFRLQQVTALFYARDDADASISVNSLSARLDSNEVNVLADLEKEGDRPFFGTATVTLNDAAGNVITEETTLFAVYVSERRRWTVDLPDGAALPATASLRLTSERTDIPEQYVLDFTPLAETVSVNASSSGP